MISTVLLILFPRAYFHLAEMFIKFEDGESLPGWRLLGILGMGVGAAWVYYGALAL